MNQLQKERKISIWELMVFFFFSSPPPPHYFFIPFFLFLYLFFPAFLGSSIQCLSLYFLFVSSSSFTGISSFSLLSLLFLFSPPPLFPSTSPSFSLFPCLCQTPSLFILNLPLLCLLYLPSLSAISSFSFSLPLVHLILSFILLFFQSFTNNIAPFLGFTKYLMKPTNDIFNPDCLQVLQDMNQPLAHYFIASSHNT